MSIGSIALMCSYVGMLLTAAAAAPQIVLVWRRQNVTGLSYLSWSLSLGSYVTWAIYGIMRPVYAQIPGNAVAAGGAVIVIALMVNHHLPVWKPVLVLSSLLLIATISTVIFGSNGVGWCAFALSTVRTIPQLSRAARHPDAAGVSIAGWAVTAVGAFSWLTYALLDHDHPVIATSGVVAGAAIGIVCLAAVHDVRWRGIRKPPLNPMQAPPWPGQQGRNARKARKPVP